MKNFLAATVTVIVGIFPTLAEEQFGPAQTASMQTELVHDGLTVSDNGRHLVLSDGTPFLWIGDTAWGLFQQVSREDVDRYLDDRVARGFTVIQTVAAWYPHGGGIKVGPYNPENAYGHRPFGGDADAPDTARPLTREGGSPSAPNDYWDNVDYVVEAVRKRNLVLALLPNWGNYVTAEDAEINEQEARAYGEFLGARYKDQSNIVWIMGGDTRAQVGGYDKHHREQVYDKRHVFRAMSEGIAKGVTGQSPKWNEKHPAWDDVFMTYHPNGDSWFNSSTWFHGDAWLDVNGVEVWKEVGDVHSVMLADYQLKDPMKPSLFLEGSYEFGAYLHECGWVTPLKVRRQFYHSFFAGAAGHTYGAGPIWAMRGTGGTYNCGYTWQQALEFPGAKQVAGIAQKFLREHAWYQWVPDGNVLAGRVGLGAALKAGVRSTAGDMALVYFSNNSHAAVRNTLEGPAQAYWFNPQDGDVEDAAAFSSGQTRTVAPPTGWEDAILVLKAG